MKGKMMMKGYKALDKDMRSAYGNKMQFELAKRYTVKGEVVLRRNGFHFCKSIEYLNCYYDIKDSRIFEVEVYGDIKNDDHNYAAEGIQLVRELTQKEINDYFKQYQQFLIYCEDIFGRKAVAEQGYGLDILVHDSNYKVRTAVAEQGYGLDILIHDEDCYVRSAVAEQGYGLDQLISDKEWQVRRAVAKQNFGLDVLIYDEDYDVRRAVAQQGYGLEILIHDKERCVREAAEEAARASKIA